MAGSLIKAAQEIEQKEIMREYLIKAVQQEPEQKKYSNDRKRGYNHTPDSEGKNNSSPSKRHKQQNQQDYRSRY